MISYGAVQSSYPDTKTTWLGGMVGGKPGKVEKMTLSEVTAKAIEEAGISGRPVQYKTEGAKMVHQAFPDYGKSKCNLVHVKAFEHGKLAMNTVKEICDRNYELKTPYVPNLQSIPNPESVPRIR